MASYKYDNENKSVEFYFIFYVGHINNFDAYQSLLPKFYGFRMNSYFIYYTERKVHIMLHRKQCESCRRATLFFVFDKCHSSLL